MLEASQPWNLFGYDLRHALHYFRAGWGEFLWGDASPVLGAIDEVARVQLESGEVLYYQAGKRVAAPPDTNAVVAQAIVLPDALVLSKPLRLPSVAEAEIHSVVALEVSASSPFPPADTCYGWSITGREADYIELQLVISSQGAIMTFVAAHTESHDVHAREVWAQVDDRMVVVTGFGEAGRQQRNRRRLVRMAALGAYCLAAIVILFGIAATAKYLELQKVRDIQARVEQTAGEAVELRTSLGASKSMIDATSELLSEHPSVRVELERLATILGDDTWLELAEINGSNLKIEGESSDASSVMQQLLDHPAYSRVEAPVAIKKVTANLERFVLHLTLAGEDAGG